VKDAALVLDILDATHRIDLEGDAYLRNLVERATPLLDRGRGVVAYTYEAIDPAHPSISELAHSERFDPSWLASFYAAVAETGLDLASQKHPTGFSAWSHLTCAQVSGVPKMAGFVPLLVHFGGARDVFAVNALDASGRGLWLGAPWPKVTKEPKARFELFERVAGHLRAACRLRRQNPGTSPRAEAVLSQAGKVLHHEAAALAETGLPVNDARDELRRAVVALEHARSNAGRRDVDGATRGWRPLVLSRWSLVDHFDSDGRRFVVAVENRPPTRPPRNDLSEREHQILTHAHLGHSNKVIAYELGLSASTVRVLLHRAARKLGVATRAEAIARFDQLTKRAADV